MKPGNMYKQACIAPIYGINIDYDSDHIRDPLSEDNVSIAITLSEDELSDLNIPQKSSNV